MEDFTFWEIFLLIFFSTLWAFFIQMVVHKVFKLIGDRREKRKMAEEYCYYVNGKYQGNYRLDTCQRLFEEVSWEHFKTASYDEKEKVYKVLVDKHKK